MGAAYLIDTNTAIYFLDELLPEKAMDFLEKALNEHGSLLSVISKIELLSWQAPTAEAMKQVENFVGDSIIFFARRPGSGQNNRNPTFAENQTPRRCNRFNCTCLRLDFAFSK